MDDEELAKIREKRMAELRDRFTPKSAPMAGHTAVLTVDEHSFARMLQEHPALVIDFWAEWCGPCRRVAPIVDELAQEFSGKVTFAKCDTDRNQRLALQFGISAIPCLILFSHGGVADRVIGALPKETIRNKIIRAFGVS
ncbi:MAG TPA: thioredoxin [Methanoregulaceae archaeon]|nr:thioredoxin [Methanoregulaceae archaeon]HPD75032.1 thioredoxin [Methanoregulaceae archaeon]HRY75679.1 thioredoxin [Methanoregulaceae archaeon]